MMYWGKGTEVNRPLLKGFMFIWLGVRLCLLFTVAVGSRGSNFLLLSYGFPRDSFLNMVGALPILSAVMPYYHTGAHMML